MPCFFNVLFCVFLCGWSERHIVFFVLLRPTENTSTDFTFVGYEGGYFSLIFSGLARGVSIRESLWERYGIYYFQVLYTRMRTNDREQVVQLWQIMNCMRKTGILPYGKELRNTTTMHIYLPFPGYVDGTGKHKWTGCHKKMAFPCAAILTMGSPFRSRSVYKFKRIQAS